MKSYQRMVWYSMVQRHTRQIIDNFRIRAQFYEYHRMSLRVETIDAGRINEANTWKVLITEYRR